MTKNNKQALALEDKINKKIRKNNNKKFVCTHSNGKQYHFNHYRDLNQFGNEIYNRERSLDDARNEQNKMQILISKLREYGATNTKKVKSRQDVLDDAKSLCAIRNDIININAFDQGIFLLKNQILQMNKKVNK